MKKSFFLLLAAVFAAFLYMPAIVNAAICFPSVSVDEPTVDFGLLDYGVPSTTKYVTFTNSSSSDCAASIIGVTGPTGDTYGAFTWDNACASGSIAVGGACAAGFTFTPVANTDGVSDFTSRYTFSIGGSLFNIDLIGSGPGDNTALLVSAAKLMQDDPDGCSATAATGAAGKKAYGPAALGLVAMLGLVMATAAVRRRSRKRD